MRQHGVRRIFAMGTVSIVRPEDKSSLLRWAMVRGLRLFASGAWSNIIAIQEAFEDEEATKDIDWTVFRIAAIPGESDAESWKKDREDGTAYVGPLGGDGWSLSQKRSSLTRWITDAAESGAPDLIRQMPVVSRKSGS